MLLDIGETGETEVDMGTKRNIVHRGRVLQAAEFDCFHQLSTVKSCLE